jgi:glutamine synthetase
VIAAGTDPAGVLRGKRLSVPYFQRAIREGIGFSSSLLRTTTMDDALPGTFEGGLPDLKGVPDLDSFRLARWEGGAAIVILDWHWADGTPCELCPRGELKRQVERLAAHRLEALCALELEFYLLATPIEALRRGGFADVELRTRDNHTYSVYEGAFSESILKPLRACFGDAVEGSIPEWGQGQLEVNLAPRGPLAAADLAVLLKTAVKQLAAQAGLSATFMAKLREDLNGSSGHIHQSLRASGTGRSASFDPSRPHRLSEAFEAYVAGLLLCLRETALFFAPSANSYKRLKAHTLAGTSRSWGIDNRTTGLRIINGCAAACRVEHRVGGADLNPYTALAACLGAGCLGVERGLRLPSETRGDAYATSGLDLVPGSLAEAVEAADSSPLTRAVLAPRFVDNLLDIARHEVGVFARTVTGLERRRYFEMA